MRSYTKVDFSRYSKGATSCPNEGCTIPLNRTGMNQYFSSNTHNLYLVLSGNLRTDYEDGTVQIHENPYSNTWGSYVDSWMYDRGVQAYIRTNNDIVLKVAAVNTSFSQLTVSIAKIVNEEISKITNKRSFIYVYGEGFEYKKDGNLIDISSTYAQMAGNTTTHSITANSTPVTVVFIEEN